MDGVFDSAVFCPWKQRNLYLRYAIYALWYFGNSKIYDDFPHTEMTTKLNDRKTLVPLRPSIAKPHGLRPTL